MAKNERTSSPVASIAGRLLNGTEVKNAEAWLEAMLTSSADSADKVQALAILRLFTELKTLAASALTQARDK